MSLFKIILISLLFVQVACLRSPREATSQVDGVETNADFKSLEVVGKSISDKKNDTWKIPTEKTYEFRACLISRATNGQLPMGQIFEVAKPDKSSFEVKTDNLGCLVWQEVVPFNFTADSVYIQKTRTIIGKGTHRGSEVLKLAINPWMEYRQEAGNEVIDLNRGNIAVNSLMKEEESEAVLSGLFSRGRGRDLLIEPNPSLQVIPVRDIADGKEVKVILRVAPYIEPVNMNGDPVKFNLRSGQFRIFAQIVGNYVGLDSKKTVILTPELTAKEVQLQNNGVLSFVTNIPLKRRVSMGQVQLALKIVPVNAPFPVNDYEGLHNIGTFDQLFSASPATQVEGVFSDKRFDYSKFIEGATNFEELKSAGFAQDLPPVYFSLLEPRFVRVASGETATRRTIIYRISTQVTDSVTGKPVAFQPFRIKRSSDGLEEQIESDQDGYIRWMDEVTHLYYVPEQYFFPKANITHLASNKVMELTMAINPWDEGWTFGADVRGNEAYYQRMSQVKVRESLFMVDAFRYQTIRFRYVIDEFLTLNVKKAVVMALDPLVQRFTIREGRKKETLRDGIYLVKIALVKYYLDPFQNGTHLVRDPESGEHEIKQVRDGGEARKGEYTTVIKKLVRVQAGRITTPLEFSMRDLRMMSIRSNIMVQIETIDEQKLLRDNIVFQKFTRLMDDYIAYNSEGMTEADKEAFIAEKQRLFDEETEKLRETMERELEILSEQRKMVSDMQYKRYEIISQLEQQISDSAALQATQAYQDALKLPRLEFEAMIQKARDEMSQMEIKMSEYWAEWEKEWQESQAVADANGLVAVPEENNLATKSYLDYLGIMQSFMTDFGIPEVVGISDLNKMQLNNYSQNPAAPFINLDLYRDQSGLKRRTFTGPCTLVANDNLSEMRPTDTIDETYCKRIDCSEEIYEERNEVDNSEFENSAYHDSLKPFTNMHVDEVIDMHIKNEQKYEKEMDALSQMGNFVNAFNLEYVSLTDQPLKQYKPGCKFDGQEDCFVENNKSVSKANEFLGLLESADLTELIQRFFYVQPMHKLTKINDEVERQDSLEPLFDRALREGEGLLSFLENSRGPYNKGYAIGNAYARSARSYIESKWGGEAPKEVGVENVRQWLSGGLKSLKLEDAVRICHALSTQATNTLKEKGFMREDYWVLSPRPAKTAQEYLLEKCFEKVRYLPKSDEVFFEGVTFDRRYKVLRTGPYEHIAGMNMNINVGIDFGISSYQDIQTVSSLGINGVALLGVAVAGVGVVTGNPFLVGAGMAGFGGVLMASSSVNDATGANKATSTNVTAAAFLVVQKADMEITIERHEKCLTTQFTPEFVRDLNLKALEMKDEVTNKNLDFHTAMTRGFMICDGVPTETPEKVKESYYYVTQHFTAGDMLDDVNLLNHVWLLALRGKRDFNTFIQIMNAKKINSKGEVIEGDDIYDYSLSRLGKVYDQVIPTFPGMYSVQD